MLETELGEEYRSEKLSQIREKNIFLSRLITGDTVAQTFAFTRDQGQPRTPINTRRGLGHTKLYNHIQRQAKSLHRALQQKFEPSTARCCGVSSHSADPGSHNIKLTWDNAARPLGTFATGSPWDIEEQTTYAHEFKPRVLPIRVVFLL